MIKVGTIKQIHEQLVSEGYRSLSIAFVSG